MSIKYCYFFILFFLCLTNFSTVNSQVIDNDIIFIFNNENSKIFQSEKQNHVDFYISEIPNHQKFSNLINQLKLNNKVTNVNISDEVINNQRKASIYFSATIDKSFLKSLFSAVGISGIVINNRFRFVENIDNENYYNTSPNTNSIEWYNKIIEDIYTKVLWVKQNPSEYDKVKENGWLKQADDAIINAQNEKTQFLQTIKNK